MSNAEPIDALAAYGNAMARVQALEQLMRVALGEHEARKLIASGGVPSDIFGEKLLNMDFGKLEQRVCAKFDFDPEQREVMRDARGFRNYLAHQFWIHHLGHPGTREGRNLVVRHANLLARQIDRVAWMLIGATNVDAQRYSDFITSRGADPKTLSEWSSLLSEGEAVFDRTEPPPA